MNQELHIISPKPDSLASYVKKLWDKRGLIATLAKTDIKLRFSQTLLRISWIILQPLISTAVFVFFFGFILHWKSSDMPFTIYVLSGVISWNLFTTATIQGSAGFRESSTLIRKVYFPRMVIPLSKIGVAAIEVITGLVLLSICMVYYGIYPGWRIVLLPFFVALNIMFPLAIISILHSISNRYKDLLHLLPLITYFGVWITPVFFTKDILPEKLQFIWFLNPMSGIVEGWRTCLMNSWDFNIQFLPSMLCILPLFIFSAWVWVRHENSIGDFV